MDLWFVDAQVPYFRDALRKAMCYGSQSGGISILGLFMRRSLLSKTTIDPWSLCSDTLMETAA